MSRVFSPGRAPHIVVKGGQKAIDFYKKPFGAREHGGCFFKMPDGKIGHVELMIGDSPIMLANEETEHLARFQFANAVFALARKKIEKRTASKIARKSNCTRERGRRVGWISWLDGYVARRVR